MLEMDDVKKKFHAFTIDCLSSGALEVEVSMGTLVKTTCV